MKQQVLFSISLVLLSITALNAQNKEIIWSEDFERNWFVDWHVDIGTWEVGTPTVGPQSAFSGNNCAATILNGNYPGSATTRLIRHTSFTVPAASENPAIRFWHWYSISGDDWGEVQIKTSNGEWQSVSERYFNTGSDTWTQSLIDLSSFADSTIQLAFFFTSDRFNESSGWYIDEVMLVTGPQVFSNHEDFELGLGDWSVERGTWEIGIPTSGPSSAYGGQNCAGTKLDGNYSGGLDTRLVSPRFVVPSSSQIPAIRFWHWYSISGDDWGEVQIKTSKGEWQSVSERYFNTGSDTWTQSLIDLSSFADSTIQLAFSFTSDRFNESSGWYIDEVMLVTGPQVFSNHEDFELGLGDWSVERGTWEIGIPTSGPSSAYGGQNCAGTKLDGNYSGGLDTRLVSPPFIVPSSSQNPAIQFWQWFKISGDDWGEIQITVDDGITWETISNQNITTSSGSWAPFYLPLTSYSNKQARISFRFQSGTYNESNGWYIDDVRILDNSELTVYAGPDITLDECGMSAINTTVSGGTEPYIIEWFPKKGLSDPMILNPVANPSDTTTYIVKVTDANGCFRTDRIVVNANCSEANTETKVLSYSFGKPPQSGETQINSDSHTIQTEVEYGTDVTSLSATFSLSEGATATVEGVDQQSGYTINDFTNPVTYRITAEDGVTYQDWVVTVQIAPAKAPEFISYSLGIPPQIGAAIINKNEQTVNIKVENGTDLTNLVATFNLPAGASSKVGGVVQESGVTPNDFTDPVTYTITAADGNSTKDWVVTVEEAALYETDILSFSFGIPPQTGNAVVNPVTHTISIEVEEGTNVSNLVADFTLSEGASVSVAGLDQQSGVTANDFTNPLTYTVTASDEETVQEWIVTVEVEVVIGIDGNSILEMNIYPNPFSDYAVIEVNNPEQLNFNLSVYSSLGNKVFEKEMLKSESITLKKGNLPAGIYLVVLRGDRILKNKMLIIN